MYLFVSVMPRETYYADGPQAHSRTKARLEQSSGERCLIVPYQEFGMDTVREFKPRAVVMSGFGARFEDLKVSDFYGMDEVMRTAHIPILAICGSHQLAGYCFSGNLRKTARIRDLPMRKMRPGDPMPRQAMGADAAGLRKAAHFVAQGFYEMERVQADPIFAGLPEKMIFRCSHYCEIKKLPPGFDVLARSGHCGIEAMKQRGRCFYGLQFHAEYFEPPFFHGRTVLENFAAIVNNFWERAG
jgi:GMP synthase-like glutamine amidotransferase